MTVATLITVKYNATPPTLLDGQQVQLQGNASGYLQVVGTVDLGATDNAVLDDINNNIFAVRSSAALLDDSGVGNYETVAASQTAQVLGAAGAVGDWLEMLTITPATTSPGNVIILDNATSHTVFVGGASSVTTLHPFNVVIRARSVSGAWKVTTGASVSVFATGSFS